MRTFGTILIAAGCIGGILFFAADTTVETSNGHRVHNIGLVSDRQNGMIGSGVALIVGVLLFGFGEIAAQRTHKGPWCPACKGPLSGEGQICRHCRSPLRWVDQTPMTLEGFAAYENDMRLRRAQFERDRAAGARAAAELNAKIKHAAGQGAKTGTNIFVAAITAAGRGFVGFDSALRKGAGDGNDILYRFFQIIVYFGVAAVVPLVLFFRR